MTDNEPRCANCGQSLTSWDQLHTVRDCELEELRAAARCAVNAWEQFNDPKIRVGPVYPTMTRLKALVGSGADQLRKEKQPHA